MFKPVNFTAILLFFAIFINALAVEITGELKKWHKVTLTLDGPESAEAADPNPFMDYRLNVTFTNGTSSYLVPGYFAADGHAANTSATAGNKWRVHFMPDAAGEWSYTVSFRQGDGVAVDDRPQSGSPVAGLDGETGSFNIGPTDKPAPDMRAFGRLDYVGGRYLQFAETGHFFLKGGPDAPENLFAYTDFDGGFKTDGVKDDLVRDYTWHLQDWREGDPFWQDTKGKGLVGAVNYLASKGMNTIAFLTLNINGDDRNVFMYTDYDERSRIDVSRMDQWEIFFQHASSKGFHLHFKTQEAENQTLLDGGDTGPERKLYYRELIARFSHHPAISWNMGEENGEWGGHTEQGHFQTAEQRRAMAAYMWATDPYHHNIDIHQGQWFDDIYGSDFAYTGASVQAWQPNKNHDQYMLQVINKSKNAGKQWVVACDEQGPASTGVVPDEDDYWHDQIRQEILWGTLLAGGYGVEYYFGYQYPHSDLNLTDFRSRDHMFTLTKIALDYFYDRDIPFWDMDPHDHLLSKSSAWCLANPGQVYLIYARQGGDVAVDLSAMPDTLLSVEWFDPRSGQSAIGKALRGGTDQTLYPPPPFDTEFAALVRFVHDTTPPGAPGGPRAEATGERRVKISWDAAGEDNSGIGGYIVYRDNAVAGAVPGDSLQFIDTDLTPGTTYSYTVTAMNLSGVEGPPAGPVDVTTWEDTTPPRLLKVIVQSPRSIIAVFSEEMDKGPAETEENYTISGGIGVKRCSIRKGFKEVRVITEQEHLEGVSYTLTVTGVKDLAGLDVSPEANTAQYQISGEKIWLFAEDAERENGAQLISFDGTLGNQAAVCPTAAAKLRFKVQIPEDGEWFIWGRLYYIGSDNDPNSFFLSVDGGEDEKLGNNKDYWNQWHWDGDGNVESGSPVALSLGQLEAGEHTLEFQAREPLGNAGTDKVMLDMLYISAQKSDEPADDGAPLRSDIDVPGDNLPTGFELQQNFPNPFNPQTAIGYYLPLNADVKLTVTNTLGQKVKTVNLGRQSAGRHQFLWTAMDGSGNKVPSGIYFYRLTAKGPSQAWVETKKMLLLK